MVESVEKSCITGDLGVSLTNAYLARGQVIDKDTLIAQPYLDLYFKLYEGDGFLNRVTFNLPLWWSIHDVNKPNRVSTTRNWIEFDWNPGLSFTFAKDYLFTVSYLELVSPADVFPTSRNINLRLDYNDSNLLGMYALHPHARVLFEVDNHSGLGTRGNTKGQMYEFGIAPSYTFEKDSAYPVTLTLPATVAFGTNGYYGHAFGYFSVGGSVSVPLAFIPSCYGTWSTSLTGLYYRLGSIVANRTDNPLGTAKGRQDQGVISWSIGTSF
jgi:hypothetical protein